MRPRIAPLSAVGLVALASFDGWLLLSSLGRILEDDPPAEQRTKWRPELSGSDHPAVVQKPIEEYPLIVAHPVFFKTREPFVPPPPPPPPAPPKAAQPPPPAPADPGLVLGGVMTNGHLRKAYLLTKNNSAGSWVTEGETFMGWVIKSVEGSTAKVQQQDRTIELHLYPQGPR